MRIVPVTGDLPAVASTSPARPPLTELPAPTPPVVVATARSGDAGRGAGRDEPRQRTLLPFFDPPLIAQRAALGLPIGALVADYAKTEGIPYTAAAAAVDRELRSGRPTD